MNEDLRKQIIEELTTPGLSDSYSSTALMVANRARREWEEVALKWKDQRDAAIAEIGKLARMNRALAAKNVELEKSLDLMAKG